MTGGDWSVPSAPAIALYLDGADDPDRAADGAGRSASARKPSTKEDFVLLRDLALILIGLQSRPFGTSALCQRCTTPD